MARSEFAKRFPARESALAKALAANVRRLRSAKGWTQGEFAAAVGIDQPAVSVIENGRANPTLLFLEEVADALDVGFQELFEVQAKSKKPKR